MLQLYKPTTSFYPFSQLFDGPRPFRYLSASSLHPEQRIHNTPERHYNELTSIFDSMMGHESCESNSFNRYKPEVKTNLFNLRKYYQIKLDKKKGGFEDYVITYTTNSNQQVTLLVRSEQDRFEKQFMFRSKDIKVNHIDYNITGSKMTIVVPKRHTNTHSTVTCSSTHQQSSHHSSKPKSPKSLKSSKSSRRLSDHTQTITADAIPLVPQSTSSKKHIISVPISSEEEEWKSLTDANAENILQSDTASYSSDTDSELGHLPKVMRKVSLEDIDDEGF